MANSDSTAPVVGEVNERGVPNNEWDLYWWQQNHKNDTTNPSSPNNQLSGISMYGTPQELQGESAARQNASIYYGNPSDIGQNAADYRARIKAKVDQPSALANQMTQSANEDISRANAKAGLSGVDTSARNISERRNSQAKADEAQQASDSINLANYGKSIGAGISGTEALAAAGAGRGEASTPTPTPSYGGGIFGGSIICTELYRQEKINIRELIGCRDFGLRVDEEVYLGYLVIAKPIVSLMKKSDMFSNLFIGWAKALSDKKPNKFTQLMIPICRMIGKLKLEVGHARQS